MSQIAPVLFQRDSATSLNLCSLLQTGHVISPLWAYEFADEKSLDFSITRNTDSNFSFGPTGSTRSEVRAVNVLV